MASKKELYYRLEALFIETSTAQALCDYFDSSELEGFVEHLEEEATPIMGSFDKDGNTI